MLYFDCFFTVSIQTNNLEAPCGVLMHPWNCNSMKLFRVAVPLRDHFLDFSLVFPSDSTQLFLETIIGLLANKT